MLWSMFYSLRAKNVYRCVREKLLGIGVHRRVNFAVLAPASKYTHAQLVISVRMQGKRNHKAGWTAVHPFKVLLDDRKGRSTWSEMREAKSVRSKLVFFFFAVLSLNDKFLVRLSKPSCFSWNPESQSSWRAFKKEPCYSWYLFVKSMLSSDSIFPISRW